MCTNNPPLKVKYNYLKGGFSNGKKETREKNQKLLNLIREQYQSESAEDVQNALKDLTSGLLEEILKAELDEHLDYDYGEKPLD